MAPGQEIRREDLPDDLLQSTGESGVAGSDWQSLLRQWARLQLAAGKAPLLKEALPAFERILIDAALHYTGGRRQEAARLLGWGRNTLTRKLKELDLPGSN